MSFMDRHHELREIAASTPPELLSPEDLDRMLRHADECAECAAGLREFATRALVAQSPSIRLAPERTAEIRSRIVASAAREREAAPPPAPRVVHSRSGWLTAAALAVALVTHHAFHEPLRSGWIAAAAFALSTVSLGIYTLAQKARIARLENRGNDRAER